MKKNHFSLRVTLFVSFLFLSPGLVPTAMAQKLQDEQAADKITIYTNGNLITMDDDNSRAEAMAIKNGIILSVGKAKDIKEQFKNQPTDIIDLYKKTVLPGFIDGHSHFSQAAASIGFVDISPSPISTGNDKGSIIDALKKSDQFSKLQQGDFLIAYGYDQTSTTMTCEGSVGAPPGQCMKGLSHDDLDEVFGDIPVILIHVSMHGGLLNKAAMAKLSVPLVPEAGEKLYVNSERKYQPSNELTGLLMEQAWEYALGQAQALQNLQSVEKSFKDKLTAAQLMYASYGYTTVHDAPVTKQVMQAYQEAAEQKALFLDVVAYAVPTDLARYQYTTSYTNHFKIAGIKIIVDGSPQGLTALFSQPYKVPGPNLAKSWCGGVANTSQDDLNQYVADAYKAKAQVLTHVNGDAAVQMVLDAHLAAGAPKDMRTTPIHSQFVTADQLKSYAEYGFTPSFFTNHTYFWGDLHVKNLGRERANFLSPMASGAKLGLHMTNHSDFFVTPPDPIFILWTSVNRISRNRKVIGKNERLSVMQGLKALTSDGAYQYHEESSKGKLKEGMVADMVMLSQDPTAIPVKKICDIEILATYKANILVADTSKFKPRVLNCKAVMPKKIDKLCKHVKACART
ncbi:amidohydrolase [Undibacterium sp. Ji50W]|uniref:amidohydrolase n=1 Tax=Undibacterium sp. Ji50W TaxID=3413041 RepID=UPI003BEF750C